MGLRRLLHVSYPCLDEVSTLIVFSDAAGRTLTYGAQVAGGAAASM